MLELKGKNNAMCGLFTQAKSLKNGSIVPEIVVANT